MVIFTRFLKTGRLLYLLFLTYSTVHNRFLSIYTKITRREEIIYENLGTNGLTISSILMKNGHTFKFLQDEHRKIFKVFMYVRIIERNEVLDYE